MDATTSAGPDLSRSLDAGIDEVRVSPTEIARVVESRFAIRVASIAAVGAESAAVFRVAGDDGIAVAVKTFWGDVPANSAVHWQQEVVRRLAEAGLPVARPRLSVDGELTVQSRTAGRALLVQVSDWLTGAPLEDVPVTGELLRETGRMAARLHGSLRQEHAPSDLEEHAWQITGARPTIERALSRIAHLAGEGRLPGMEAEVERLERAADAVFFVLDADVAPRMRELPTAVVHHDLHDSNLLVGPTSAPMAITGILDFGDMTRSLRISEPAIAGAYAARHCADPVAALRHIMDGWAESVTVTADEAAVVLPLAAARLVTNASVWMSRLDTPRSAYAAARRRGSLETAERLLAAV